jgi:hypothetical protein
MALTFTRVPLVTARPPRSSDAWHLANGVIERVLSGLGNPTRRMGILWHRGLFAQPQTTDTSFTLPPQADYWTRFQQRDPDGTPFFEAHSGELAGPNRINPLNLYLYGYEETAFLSERARLQAVPTAGPHTPWALWGLAKTQRGAYDLASGERAAPFLDLAEAFAQIRYGPLSPYGNGFGGMLPGPETDGANPCDYDAELEYTPQNLLLFWTRISDGEVVSFAGTCPEQPTHIAGISYQPFGTYVFLNNGSVRYFAKSEWIEGPYTGNAQLRKTDAQMLSRVQSYHAGEYRGTAAQIAASGDVGLSVSFHVQSFGTRQFALAPASGTGDGAGGVAAVYPQWSGGVLAAGAALTLAAGSAAWPLGTVCHGWAATATGLAESVTLELRDGATVLATLTLTPDGSGAAEAIAIFSAAKARLAAASVHTTNAITAGTITVEASALVEYQPLPHDWFAVCRLAQWSDTLALDGRGVDCEEARTISNDLLTYGCVLSLAGGEGGFTPPAEEEEQKLNLNGFADSARRFSQLVRFVSRAQFVDLALENGNTVLWFARLGGDDGADDLFDGLGPSRSPVASGALLTGRVYEVVSGSILYETAPKMTGDTFTATDELTFTGDGVVMEHNGIEQVAIPSHFTNRWVLDVDSLPYHLGEGSLWNPPEYYDAKSPLITPEHIGSAVFRYSPPHLRHFEFRGDNSFPPIYPEGVDAYTYAPTPDSTHSDPRENWVNCSGDVDCENRRIQFYRSRRLYEPPLEITHVTRELSDELVTPLVPHQTELVRVQLNGRLHHHESYPANWSRDRSTWNLGALGVETNERRTRENALREYLLLQDNGRGCSKNGVGNLSLNVGAGLDADYPEGSCYPWFQFTRLPRQPYMDENHTLDPDTDSPMESSDYREVELWLHAMASGFVDGVTSAQTACARYTADGTTDYGPFCFTTESLFYQAEQNRWPRWFPESVRADNPYSHGPSPAQRHYAEHHNLLAAAINELRTIPIWLPMSFEAITRTWSGNFGLQQGYDQCSAPADCSTGTTARFASAVSVGTMGTPSGGTWTEFSTGDTLTLNGNVYLGHPTTNCDGTLWNLTATTQTAQFRWSPADDSVEALLPEVAELLNTAPVILFAKLYTRRRVDRVELTDLTEAELTYTAGGEGAAFCDPDYAVFRETTWAWSSCELTDLLELPEMPGGLVGNYHSGGGSPLFTATYGPEVTATAVLLSDGSAIIRVPLTEPDDQPAFTASAPPAEAEPIEDFSGEDFSDADYRTANPSPP